MEGEGEGGREAGSAATAKLGVEIERQGAGENVIHVAILVHGSVDASGTRPSSETHTQKAVRTTDKGDDFE